VKKTHFSTAPATSLQVACGRHVNEFGQTPFTNSVTCGHCRNSPEFATVKADQDAKREAAFQAQEPHTIVPQFGRVNDDGVMDCYQCHGVLFRERPRSTWCYNYVCAACGTSMHPLTETGMCT
jgi:hypothetical protein